MYASYLQNSLELLLSAGVNAAASLFYAVTGFSKYLCQKCSNLLYGVWYIALQGKLELPPMLL